MRFLPLLLAAVGLGSCATTVELTEFERVALQREQDWHELNRLKADANWREPRPVVFKFPEHGEVLVRRWHLHGFPGSEHILARFTYKNTTDEAMDRVRVVLTVENKRGQKISSTYVDLVHPWGVALNPGLMFTDEIKVPTNGAHWNEGWRWVVSCKALPDAAVPY